MNILYIGSIGSSTAISGGYEFISKSMDKIFKELNEDEIITNYTSIDLNGKIQSVEVLCEQYDIGIILTHPISFKSQNFKNNIIKLKNKCNKFYLHVFWEVSKFPKSWDWLFDKDETIFNGFISSSDYVSNLLGNRINNNQKIFKIRPYIKEEEYKDYKIDKLKKIDEKIFNVLYVGQYTKRKGMEDAIIAFTRAFSDKTDCSLTLKYHRLSNIECDEHEMIKRTIAMNCESFKPKIYEITDNLNKDQIFEMYSNASCLLFPSRGEGFGLPIMETGIVGLPIIYANNSSCSEVVGKNTIERITCKLDEATGMSHYGYEKGSEYGIPNMSEMIESLEYFYSIWKDDKTIYYKFDDEDRNFIFEKYGKQNVTNDIVALF